MGGHGTSTIYLSLTIYLIKDIFDLERDLGATRGARLFQSGEGGKGCASKTRAGEALRQAARKGENGFSRAGKPCERARKSPSCWPDSSGRIQPANRLNVDARIPAGIHEADFSQLVVLNPHGISLRKPNPATRRVIYTGFGFGCSQSGVERSASQ